MNKSKQTLLSTCLLLSGTIISSTALAGGFDNRDVNVRWEVWDISPKDGGTVLATIDELDIKASSQNTPDIRGFHNHIGGGIMTTFELWNIDFSGNSIELTYTSRYVGDIDHQYMYSGAEGFHFEDTKNNLPKIIGVTVDSSFAPHGFEPSLVTFDDNNIHVDLNGSMCHIDGMGSMPDCANLNSPTDYDNQIKLNVQFASGGGSSPISKPPVANIVAPNARIDALFNWAERTYPNYFPQHTASGDIMGYYARHYTTNDVYLGEKDGRVYVYGQPFGGMQDVGELNQLFSQAGIVEQN